MNSSENYSIFTNNTQNFQNKSDIIESPTLFNPLNSESSTLGSLLSEPLLINETANLYSDETFHVGNGTNSEYSSQNTSYFLDTTHNWQADHYYANISSINDQRQWIQNPNFGAETQFEATKRINQTFTSAPFYSNNLKLANIYASINGNSCSYIRIHFVNISMESNYDYLYLTDNVTSGYKIYDNFTGYYENILTPWYNTGKINIRIYSDNSNTGYGYYIDYFEVYNGTYDYETSRMNWTYYNYSPSGLTTRIGNWTEPQNRTALWAEIGGIPNGEGGFTYYENEESGYSQNVTIPRGQLIDAWISLDYLVWNGIATNDMLIYCTINNHLIFSRGFGTISSNNQLRKWVSSGLINIKLWENSTNVFSEILSSDMLNFSIGIRTTSSVTYSGFRDREIQKVYFDQVQLIIKARANSTQSDIDLRIQNQTVTPTSNNWGEGTIHLYGTWQENPVKFNITTNSEQLELNIDSQLCAWHAVNSSAEPNSEKGVKMTINLDGSVQCDWYHNAYIPSQYEEYSFHMVKPALWTISNVLDPTGLETSFIDGKIGDNNFGVHENFAYYPGWWHFRAESLNRILANQTEIYYHHSWHNQTEFAADNVVYDVNDQFILNSTIFGDLTAIPNLASSWMNLTIYSPIHALWWEEAQQPNSYGSFLFSNITFGPENTTAGIWTYKLIWTNGTSCGGLNASFEIRHNLSYRLLYPKDSDSDLIIEKIMGDLLAIRITLNDSDNGELVTGASIQMNWTSGMEFLTEVSSGVYDASFDTSELQNAGEYKLNFTLNKVGYYGISFELTMDLIVETSLQIISEEVDIQFGQNMSLIAEFVIKDTSIGIEDATIISNLTSGVFISGESNNGKYYIEINTSVFAHAGFNTIQLNASKRYHESQSIRERLNINSKTVNFSISINGYDCSLNKSAKIWIQNNLQLTIQIFDLIQNSFIDFGFISISEANNLNEIIFIQNGTFQWETNSSLLGLGNHYLKLLFNQTDYILTETTVQIIVDPRPVSVSININNIDCSFSKTASVRIDKNINISVKVLDQVSLHYITVGSLSFSDYANFSAEIYYVDASFEFIFNSSQLGIGVHFLSILFNHDAFEKTAITIQFIVEQSTLNPQLYLTNGTILSNPNQEFVIKFILYDEDNSLLSGAQITYSWVFGSGFLTEIEKGIYSLNATTPSQLGSYDITFTISLGSSYRTQSMKVTLVNQSNISGMNRNLLWIVLIGSAITIILLGLIIKLNVLNPQRARKLTELEKRTHVLEDVQSIQAIMVIQKSSGLLLYNHSILAKKEEHDLLVTGFLQAIMMFSSNITGAQQSEVNTEGLEFNHNKFNIFVSEGKYIRVAVILTNKASIQIRNQSRTFISEFEQIFAEFVANWDGNTDVFRDTTSPMISKIFRLEYLKEYTWTKSSILKEALPIITKPNTLSQELYQIIETLVKDRKIFKIGTVLALIPPKNKLRAKELLLQWIEQKLIINPSADELKIIQIEEKMKDIPSK